MSAPERTRILQHVRLTGAVLLAVFASLAFLVTPALALGGAGYLGYETSTAYGYDRSVGTVVDARYARSAPTTPTVNSRTATLVASKPRQRVSWSLASSFSRRHAAESGVRLRPGVVQPGVARSVESALKLLGYIDKDAAGAMVEQHTLAYIDSGKYLNGNRVSDVFQLKGPDASAPCYAATCTASWTYDARERLTQEVSGTGTATTFAVDVIGNVTTETPSGGNAITRTYTGQQLATQTSAGVTTKFLYDSLGNQDCAVKSAYAGSTCPASGADLLEDWIYDYKSRLAAYRSYDGNGNPVNTVSYTNDPLDRPVKQVSTESGSTTTFDFTYLGITDQLASETLTGATNTTKRYAFDAFGRRATIADGSSRYGYLHDPHGSVSLLLDQNGAVKASYGYNAYGTSNSALTRAATGFSLATNPYRYTGKRLDTATNTLDMGARRYSRATNRFLQYDQYDGALANLGLSLDQLTGNRYALAAGNPVSFVEIDGHMVQDVEGTNTRQMQIWVQQQEQRQAAAEPGTDVGARFAKSVYEGSGAKTIVESCKGGLTRGCAKATGIEVALGRAKWLKRAGEWAVEIVKAKRAAKAVAELSDDVAATFKGGQYATRTLDEDIVLRRVYGGTSPEMGPYWSRTSYSTPGRAKQYLALPPGNTAERVVTVRVPAGTTIYEGKAAAHFGRRGGGNQVYIPRVDPAWITGRP